MNDPMGSIWRKWDLHVHTPESFHQQFGGNWDDYINDLKAGALLHGVEVMGVTDYFSVDGYEILKQRYEPFGKPEIYLSNNKILYLFPCVELRLESFDVDQSSINVHVVFSPELEPSTIRSCFLEKLEVRYRSLKLNCKREDLIRIGYAEEAAVDYNANLNILSIGETEQKKYIRKALSIITISLDSLNESLQHIKQALTENGIDEQCYLFLIAYKGHGSLANLPWFSLGSRDMGRLGNLRQTLLNFADVCFSNATGDRDFLLGKTSGTPKDEFITRFRSLKPCIWGSDAHDLSSLFKPNGNIQDYTWIKADPTFGGLRQIINEPEDRVFIGEKPEKKKHVEAYKTKYIRSLDIHKYADSTLNDEIWFDNTLEFNPGLVAIIGNKGNGKSALADVIGLLGNAKQNGFSFLNERKFRQTKNAKAKHFNAIMSWEDGTKSLLKCLNDNPDPQEVERVKYIPQNFFDNVTNELQIGGLSHFERELKNVIFSHIEEPKRLKLDSLDSLIESKTQEIGNFVATLRMKIQELNKQIVSMEDRISLENINRIKNLIKEKEAELEAHNKSKPDEVTKPQNDPEEQSAMFEKERIIEEKKGLEENLNLQIENTRKSLQDIEPLISSINKVITKIDNFSKNFEAFKEECLEELKFHNLNFEQLVFLKIQKAPLSEARLGYEQIRDTAQNQLDEKNPDSVASRKRILRNEIDFLEAELDEPNKKFQAYINNLKNWEKRKIEIIGDRTLVGTMEYYRNQLKDIENTPQLLQSFLDKRMDKVKEVYSEISKLSNVYRSLYEPVQKVTKDNEIVKDKLRLSFEVSIGVDTRFVPNFFNKVKRKGAFYQEGEAVLKKTLDKYDLNKETDVIGFLDEIMNHITSDKRQSNISTQVKVEDMLKSGETAQSLYDFLFSLEYLEPRYALRLNEKDLSELSPGERGALLLIFYLLLDKDNIPLIIDQPEENLDNQTVYKLLVPCIKEAKQRRQIFIVTHNPNLAVVCDAEQVVHTLLDKTDKYRITYDCGAIEKPGINKKIVEVLEGTRPAFDNRDSKYLVV